MSRHEYVKVFRGLKQRLPDHRYSDNLTPRVDRKWRPRIISWAGPAAFYQTRFSEHNKWYKARIPKPELLPEMHLIEPTNYYRSLAERLERDLNLSSDIGFKKPAQKIVKTKMDREEMEKLARKNQLEIDMSMLDDDPLRVCQHFNVFEDLFISGVYFHNVQKIKILFGDSSMRFGNVIQCSKAVNAPSVSIERSSGGFTTILLANMDGNAFIEEEEKCSSGRHHVFQWLVANIPDDKPVESGEEIVPYLQPIPYHGSGFHRIAFVAFRHQKPIDLSEFRPKGSHLSNRLFKTNSLLKKNEDVMTPSAVHFSQMEWNESCDTTLKALGMKSPRFWYDWDEPLKPEQREFPLKPMPFDQYLDMYRDPREVERTVRRQKLETVVHEGSIQKPKYPDIFYTENRFAMAHWRHRRLIDRNVGKGEHALLYSEFVNPAFQKDAQQTP